MKVLEGTFSPWGEARARLASRNYIRICSVPCQLSVLLLLLFLSPPLPTWPLTSIRNGEDKSYLFAFAVLAQKCFSNTHKTRKCFSNTDMTLRASPVWASILHLSYTLMENFITQGVRRGYLAPRSLWSGPRSKVVHVRWRQAGREIIVGRCLRE